MPLLHTFYRLFFFPAEAGSSAQRDMEYKISATIAKSLAVCLCGIVKRIFSNDLIIIIV